MKCTWLSDLCIWLSDVFTIIKMVNHASSLLGLFLLVEFNNGFSDAFLEFNACIFEASDSSGKKVSGHFAFVHVMLEVLFSSRDLFDLQS